MSSIMINLTVLIVIYLSMVGVPSKDIFFCYCFVFTNDFQSAN